MKKPVLFLILLILLFATACNYNYYRGTVLEDEKRFEEANIEYRRAFTNSPSNDRYREAYQRTAVKTAEDLMTRYFSYLNERKFQLAYQRLKHAQSLNPEHPKVKEEIGKWYRILLAGKVEFDFQTLKNQVPLTDQMVLEVRLNTFDPKRRLTAVIDNQTKIFSVEDVLYDPPQNLLMFYSINSIGVRLVNNNTNFSKFQKFVDFKTPILKNINGYLIKNGNQPMPIDPETPDSLIKSAAPSDPWYPSGEITYDIDLKKDKIVVSSSVSRIDFLPQILYINNPSRRYFFDFGKLRLYQKNVGGLWSFSRETPKKRRYLKDLYEHLLLNPYFYYLDGAYPYIGSNQAKHSPAG